MYGDYINPADYFFGLLGQTLKKERVSSDTYSFQDRALLEIHPLEEPLNGWDESAGQVVYIRKIFVLDEYRDSGVGTSLLQEVVRCADIARVPLLAVAKGFRWLAKPVGPPWQDDWGFRIVAYPDDFEELLTYWCDRPVEDRTIDPDRLFDWYQRAGFRRWYCGWQKAISYYPEPLWKSEAFLFLPATFSVPEKIGQRLEKETRGAA